MPVTFQSGTTRQLELSGTYEPHEVLGPLVVSLETLTAVGGSTQDRFVYVNLSNDASVSAVRRTSTR